MNGALSAFHSFDSWTAKLQISELIKRLRSSMSFGKIPSAFHWQIFSLFHEVVGRGWEGNELVDPASWGFVDSDIQFSWCTFHISSDYRESKLSGQCSISGGIPWTIHCLTGAELEPRAAEHLAQFCLELLVSARDKPWFKRDFSDGVVGRGGELWCDEVMMDG